MSKQKVATVIGGSGFLGQELTKQLLDEGYVVRVVSLNPDKPFRNWQNANLEFFTADILDEVHIKKSVKKAEIVIYSVGLLDERGEQTFDKAHVQGPKLASQLAKDANVDNFVLISAIGADSTSQSRYAVTKAQSEEAVPKNFPHTIIVRPSIVFGPNDNFFNQFKDMAKISPALPLIGGGHTKFQPVFVSDVAKAVIRACNDQKWQGQVIELGGPDILTFKECLERVMEYSGRKRFLVNLPFEIAHIQAKLLSILPNRPITKDQLILLKSDNVVSDQARKDKRTLQGLDIQPQSVADIVPHYLK